LLGILDGLQSLTQRLVDHAAERHPELCRHCLLASALGDIARARGMSEIARASGLTREALYKALRPNSKPRYDTIVKICGALGVRLVAQAIHS